MSHSPIIIDECVNEMRGDATTGGLVNLQAAYTALDAHLADLLTPEQEAAIHALLEEIQAWACEGGNYEMGAAAQVEDFTTRCNALL